MTNETALLNQLKGTSVARLTVYDLSVIPLFLLRGRFATQGRTEPRAVPGRGRVRRPHPRRPGDGLVVGAILTEQNIAKLFAAAMVFMIFLGADMINASLALTAMPAAVASWVSCACCCC